MKYLENSVETLARQTMLQQLFVDERTRSDGDSGKRAYEIKYFQIDWVTDKACVNPL